MLRDDKICTSIRFFHNEVKPHLVLNSFTINIQMAWVERKAATVVVAAAVVVVRKAAFD